MVRERILASSSFLPLAFLLLLLLVGWIPKAQAAPTLANIAGEIERITINDNTDRYSGGTIVVGGQVVTLPRNLLIDLPANRLTLQQLFVPTSGNLVSGPPAACLANRETGLAKADACNTSGAGGFAMITANRSDAGNVIAGDVFIQKGQEALTGTVTFINYTDGYYRLSGQLGVDIAGVIVRLNDPTSRHTIQQGLGCAGGPNCSPDPRFTLDPDNYTNAFITGYPYCLPSAVSRPFAGLPAITGVAALSAGTAVANNTTGTGDVLCPETNRNANNIAVDSRRFAPVQVGDALTVEGNFETINGVTFLSAHTSLVHRGLTTQNLSDHPDYLFLDEVFIDVAGFNNNRARDLFIGFATLADANGADIMIWSLHRDPATNDAHEFPLASVRGCDAAAPATCGVQGIGGGAGNNIFKIRHDVDFVLAAGNSGFDSADPKLSPCAHLRGDTRFAALNLCPRSAERPGGSNGTGHVTEEFSILSPIPHEIQARTGKKYADRLANPPEGAINSYDVNGEVATWGQYLFPFGMNLGGVAPPEMVEIDLNATGTATFFTGIPWNLDRRLSPGGCPETGCEAGDVDGTSATFRLDPFPFEGGDPRNQPVNSPSLPVSLVGNIFFNDPNFTASTLTDYRNRILSYVDGSGNFNGDSTLVLPAVVPFSAATLTALTPAAFTIVETPPLPANSPATSATLTANPASPQPAGTIVTLVASGGGGTGLYEYSFKARPQGGVFSAAQNYSTSNTFFWNPGGATGTFEFQADVRVVGSLSLAEASSPVLSFTLTPAASGSPAATATLTANPASPQPVGTVVTLAASATGGTGIYEYQFVARPQGGVFTPAQNYSTNDTFFWNPGQATGTYEWQVSARNVGSAAAFEAVSPILSYTFSAPNPAATASLTANPASPQPVGTVVTLAASATGGTGIYEYQFVARPQGGVFTPAQNYSTNSNFFWNPGQATGTFEWQVNVRNVGSGAAVEASSSILSFTLSAPNPVATAALTSNPGSPAASGTIITLLASATGGTGIYEYQFLAGPSGGVLTPAQNYSTNNSFFWNPGGATGTFDWQVNVRNVGSSATFEAASPIFSFTLQ